MKRRWRPGRLVLATALLAIATLLACAWPSTPRWRIPAEHVLGFDPTRNVLLTTPTDPDYPRPSFKDGRYCIIINAWNLETGLRASRTCLPAPDSLSSETVGHRLTLAPDANHIAFKHSDGEIEVFSLPAGRLLHRLDPGSEFPIRPNRGSDLEAIPFDAKRPRYIRSVCFSPDGQRLAAVLMWHIVIWDLTNGDVVVRQRCTIDFDAVRNDLAFTADGRFLLGHGYSDVFVLDLNDPAYLHLHKKSSRITQTSPDVVTTLDYSEGAWQLHHHRLSSLSAKKESSQQLPSAEIPLKLTSQYLITASVGTERFSWPTLLSEKWRQRAEDWFGLGRRVWVRELGTGALVRSVPASDISLGMMEPGIRKTISTDSLYFYRATATVSPDGRLLAVAERNGITLWDLAPSRPSSCWLTCTAIALFAAWLAWPRKMKLNPTTG